jgi:hypothetical protein
MDNFQAIGQLVIKAQDLLDSIKGGAIRVMQTQFDALKVQFTDKLGSVSSELNAFVNQQKANVNTIFSEPDMRYQVLHTQKQAVAIGGSRDTWYPVVIHVPSVMTNLSVSRHTHDDRAIYGVWNGALSLDLRVCARNFGGVNSVVMVDRYQAGRKSEGRVLPDSDIPFVGRVDSGVGPNHVVIWLRGETTYQLACDWGQVSFVVHDNGIPFRISGEYAEINALPVSAGAHVSLPNVGYIRGE